MTPETKKKSRPSLNPQHLRDNEHAWYYEDARGITVVSEAHGAEGVYLTTTQTRIPWSALLKSASRCGKIAEDFR